MAADDLANVVISDSTLEECVNLFEKADECIRDSSLGWERIFERSEGVILRRPLEGGLFEYLLTGEFPNLNYSDFVCALHDLQYRKDWDTHTGALGTLVEADERDGSTIIYWLVKYPWPLADRDYVFKQRIVHHEDKKMYVIVKRATSHPSKPYTSSPVRVVRFRSETAAQETATGVRYVSFYADDPGGSIPTSVVNWAVKKAVPKVYDELPTVVKNWKAKQ